MSSQKFIARNRAPRVQIEYDVELYGAREEDPAALRDGRAWRTSPASRRAAAAGRRTASSWRSTSTTSTSRLKAIKPRVAFQVPNTLTGEGNLSVDITFESMDDFSPAAVARKVEPSNKLLEARAATGEPDDVHGRQDRRRGADRQGAEGSGAAASRWPRRPSPRAPSATAEPHEPPRRTRSWPSPKPKHRRTGAVATSRQRVLLAAAKGVQAQDRQAKDAVEQRRPDAGRAGACADHADLRRRRQDDRGDHRRRSTTS